MTELRWYAREWRLSLGLTQEEVAERMGTSKGQISRYETLDRKLSVTKAFELADALGLHPADLFRNPVDGSLVVSGNEAQIVRALRELNEPRLQHIITSLEIALQAQAGAGAETPVGAPEKGREASE